MAGLGQLNSFVGKFINLWKAGLDANLELKTTAGETTLTLKAGLGQTPQPLPPQGAAYHRRLQKCRETRQTVAEQVEHDRAAAGEAVNQAEEAVHDCVPVPEVIHLAGEARHKAGEADCVAEVATTVNAENDDITVDAAKVGVKETETKDDNCEAVKASVVNDEMCSDEVYEQEYELLEVVVKAGQVEAMPGEVTG